MSLTSPEQARQPLPDTVPNTYIPELDRGKSRSPEQARIVEAQLSIGGKLVELLRRERYMIADIESFTSVVFPGCPRYIPRESYRGIVIPGVHPLEASGADSAHDGSELSLPEQVVWLPVIIDTNRKLHYPLTADTDDNKLLVSTDSHLITVDYSEGTNPVLYDHLIGLLEAIDDRRQAVSASLSASRL